MAALMSWTCAGKRASVDCRKSTLATAKPFARKTGGTLALDPVVHAPPWTHTSSGGAWTPVGQIQIQRQGFPVDAGVDEILGLLQCLRAGDRLTDEPSTHNRRDEHEPSAGHAAPSGHCLFSSDSSTRIGVTRGGRPTDALAGGRCDAKVARMCYFVRQSFMTKEVTLRQSGGSVSATFPKDMAARLHLEPGDRVLAVETDRGILLTPYDPDVERALAVGRQSCQEVSQRPTGTGEIVRGLARFRAAVAEPSGRGRYPRRPIARARRHGRLA